MATAAAMNAASTAARVVTKGCKQWPHKSPVLTVSSQTTFQTDVALHQLDTYIVFLYLFATMTYPYCIYNNTSMLK